MKLNTSEININRYINNDLKGDALIAFETLLQQDDALQQKVNFHKEVDAVLYEKMRPVKTFEKEEAALKPLLKELGNEFFLEDNKVEVQEKSKPSIVRRLLPFAALAAAAAVLLFVIAPWKNNFTNPQLASKQFEPFDLELIMDSNDNLTLYDQANAAYHQKNYQAAIPLLTQYLKTKPASPKALLAKGSAEFELNKLAEAIESFKLAAGNSSFSAIAHWYLALTHLKKDNKEAAKAALLSIKKGEEKYKAAQKLLRQIE